MPGTANAAKCEIVCSPVEVTKDEKGKYKLSSERKGRFSIEEGTIPHEIKLSKGFLTKDFKGAGNYAKALEKQRDYKQKRSNNRNER